ncbi:disulfide oxidoreductase [Pullulanibacillus sp. KACC 23026]|uniref:disulfide oxidoreductase n=1 Tax=Pullulanibacillus sp. KACC 23026 TaxID=3028315 RepID=UPI0023B0A1C9|nr:disulfide oxidoreductase [Pullulanibacillus sp. KACC 23026]WEG12543.1 disulfide oxidoreductase [Pullulanibacillus sp. KACC 23026]
MNKKLYLAWVIALIATLGSLYFSEIADFTPCKLCWFQRICMYPLTLILGMACFRNDRSISLYVLPLTIIGGCFSLLHLGEQHFHWFERICRGGGVPCSGRYINWFGFITIPLLALIAFILISVLMILIRKESINQDES